MDMKKINTFVLLLLSVNLAFAQPKKSFKLNTKQMMNDALQAYIKLIPYIDSDMKFSDPQNRDSIKKNLKKLEEMFLSSKHMRELKKPGFSPPRKVITNHINDAVENLNRSNWPLARLQVAATLGICMSCHTQLPEERRSSFSIGSKKINRDHFSSDENYAEHLYLVRKYNQSLKYYDLSLNKRLGEQKKFNSLTKKFNIDKEYVDKILLNDLKKSLSIFLKIKKSPELAGKFLSKYKNRIESKYITTQIESWEKRVQYWKNKKIGKNSFKSENAIKMLLKDVEIIFESQGLPNDVDLLVINGYLGNYLNLHPKSSIVPSLLLWVGRTSQLLNRNFFYEIGDQYLTSCIRDFSKSTVAKKCFEYYKEHIEFSYSGSSGTNIPEYKKKELKELEKLVK